MDMNMVRAGMVGHPSDWAGGGAADLAGQRKRYRIIDQEQLLTCLGMPGQWEAFRTWHAATLAELCARPATPAEPYWSSAFAVGTPKWLSGLGGGRMNVSEYIEPVGGDGEDDLHALRLPQSVAARLWQWRGSARTKP